METLVSRRGLIRGAGALVASAVLFGGLLPELSTPAMAAAANSAPLRLTNAHTGEAYDVDLFLAGDWNKNALIVCDYLLRDWRQKQVVECDRKLYAALYVLQTYFSPGGRIQINSGFRTVQTNEALREAGYNPAVNSMHLRAMAVDFLIPGAPLQQVARAARALKMGGVGLYNSDNFVHMDSRGVAANGHQAQWGDSF